jgi:hypothetical protein
MQIYKYNQIDSIPSPIRVGVIGGLRPLPSFVWGS